MLSYQLLRKGESSVTFSWVFLLFHIPNKYIAQKIQDSYVNFRYNRFRPARTHGRYIGISDDKSKVKLPL
jgi:hypothetical protein